MQQLDTLHSHNIINNFHTNIRATNDAGIDVSLIVAHATVAGFEEVSCKAIDDNFFF